MSFQKLYEDKNLENEVYDIVCNLENYSDAIIENNQYDYQYFLSPLRHNLFLWYPFKKEGSLLEIGAGYGQLTSLFTEKVNRVVAIEDSESKCNIISKRAEDADVLLSDFNDIPLDEKFDYIILCNVFEYAKSFVDSENPYVDYLNYLKGFLKDDGVILMALSNRLGLKYFAGYREEHTNRLFKGINGYSDVDYVQTFSKSEITDIINASAFSNLKFFYPTPNHEFPQVLNTDKLINDIPFIGVDLYSDDRIHLFDDMSFNLSLSQEKISQHFANSFLIEIRSSDKTYPTDNMDFIKLGTDREDEFSIYTIIWSDGKVSKSPASSKAEDHIRKMFDRSKYSIGKIKCLNAEMRGNSLYYDFLKEKSYEILILEAVENNDKDRFFKLLEDAHDALFYNSFETDKYATEEFLEIFKEKSDIKFHCHQISNIDLIFSNIFLIDGEFVAIDYEWIYDFPIPLEFIFYKIISYHFYSSEMLSEFSSREEVYEYFGMDPEIIELFIRWNRNYLGYIINRPPLSKPKVIPLEKIERIEQLQEDIALKNREIEKKNAEIKNKDEEIIKKDKEIKKKNKEIIKKDKEIKKFLNSKSWKMTKPIRHMKSVFKDKEWFEKRLIIF